MVGGGGRWWEVVGGGGRWWEVVVDLLCFFWLGGGGGDVSSLATAQILFMRKHSLFSTSRFFMVNTIFVEAARDGRLYQCPTIL